MPLAPTWLGLGLRMGSTVLRRGSNPTPTFIRPSASASIRRPSFSRSCIRRDPMRQRGVVGRTLGPTSAVPQCTSADPSCVVCRVLSVASRSLCARKRAARSTPSQESGAPVRFCAVPAVLVSIPHSRAPCGAWRLGAWALPAPPATCQAACPPPAAHPGLKSKPKKQKLRYRQYTALYRLHFFGARREIFASAFFLPTPPNLLGSNIGPTPNSTHTRAEPIRVV